MVHSNTENKMAESIKKHRHQSIWLKNNYINYTQRAKGKHKEIKEIRGNFVYI